MRSGASAVRPIRRFDVSDYPCQVGAFLPDDFDFADHLDSRLIRKLDPSQALSVIATGLALEHANLDPRTVDEHRFGAVIGSALGPTTAQVTITQIMERQTWKQIRPHTGVSFSFSGVSAAPAIQYGLNGLNRSVCCACASGNMAIAQGTRAIQNGLADRLIAGGADYLQEFILPFFLRIRAIATSKDPLDTDVMKPFDQNRIGTILGEGAAMMVLESEEAARARGATIYAEILGSGEACDAYSMVMPRPDALPMIASIENCLADARISPSDVDLVCAHGTATPPNDRTEVKALKQALGNRAYEVPVTSLKSITGHGLGASSAIETVAQIAAGLEGLVHPTVNLETPDSECDLDHVPGEARRHDFQTFLNLSFGFGGHDVVVAARVGDPG